MLQQISVQFVCPSPTVKKSSLWVSVIRVPTCRVYCQTCVMNIGGHSPLNIALHKMKQYILIYGIGSTKVLFTVRYTNRQITALTFFAITKTITKIAKKWDY